LRLAAAALRAPAQDRVHLVAFEPRHRLGDGQVGELVDQPLENAPADLGVRHFAAAEQDRRLHLVAVLEEAFDVLLLELVVVLVDLRPEFDFFDENHLLVPPGLTRALLLLVLILPEIHDAADRRVRRRRDLDQVEPLLLGDRERLRRRHDAELRAAVVDHADFANADAFIDADAIIAPRATGKSDNYLLATADSGPPCSIGSTLIDVVSFSSMRSFASATN